MPGKDYTDFLERWYYLRPTASNAKADHVQDAEPKSATEQGQAIKAKTPEELKMVEARN
jgi:hypothetical protein